MTPKPEDINPDIVALAKRNGMVRQFVELYLRGELTWTQALEMMVTTLGKEVIDQRKLLVECASFRPAPPKFEMLALPDKPLVNKKHGKAN